MTTARRLALILVVTAFGHVTACGGDDSGTDRTAEACRRVVDAACAKLVECRATNDGTLITPTLCTQVRARSVDDCIAEDGPGISAATDTEIDACVLGFQGFLCTNLCGQVPDDPPACQTFDPTPNVTTITCAP